MGCSGKGCLDSQNMTLRCPTHTPGCRQGGQFPLLTPSQMGTQKSPKSLMFTTFFYASFSILGRGITRLVPESIFCWVSPAPWHFLVDPQEEICMPEDSTFAPLPCPGAILDLARSAGPVEPGLFMLLLWCWTQPSLVPQAPSETLSEGNSSWKAVSASFITSHPGYSPPPNTFRVTATSPDKCNALLSKPTTHC